MSAASSLQILAYSDNSSAFISLRSVKYLDFLYFTLSLKSMLLSVYLFNTEMYCRHARRRKMYQYCVIMWNTYCHNKLFPCYNNIFFTSLAEMLMLLENSELHLCYFRLILQQETFPHTIDIVTSYNNINCVKL